MLAGNRSRQRLHPRAAISFRSHGQALRSCSVYPRLSCRYTGRPVLWDKAVAGDEHQLFERGLGNPHTVERGAMEIGQNGRRKAVVELNRQGGYCNRRLVLFEQFEVLVARGFLVESQCLGRTKVDVDLREKVVGEPSGSRFEIQDCRVYRVSPFDDQIRSRQQVS